MQQRSAAAPFHQACGLLANIGSRYCPREDDRPSRLQCCSATASVLNGAAVESCPSCGIKDCGGNDCTRQEYANDKSVVYGRKRAAVGEI